MAKHYFSFNFLYLPSLFSLFLLISFTQTFYSSLVNTKRSIWVSIVPGNYSHSWVYPFSYCSCTEYFFLLWNNDYPSIKARRPQWHTRSRNTYRNEGLCLRDKAILMLHTHLFGRCGKFIRDGWDIHETSFVNRILTYFPQSRSTMEFT